MQEPKYRSVFDIIGPVMIGPSSSHTAGAVRIGKLARALHGMDVERAEITFYGSFKETYRGHGTDTAITAGILNMDPHDERVREALALAREKGVAVEFLESTQEADHPNTARVRLMTDMHMSELVGISIGGGKVEIVEILGFPVHLGGDVPTLIIRHIDRHGMIARVAQVLADYAINIATMHVSRKGKGEQALMTIEVDELPPADALTAMQAYDGIIGVSLLYLP
ncbi:MAG: L-serine ammonia-lyase, iron-sulfur-dependent, subunit beta [Candidatus Carbobacillus altaicus]|uniref:L-serine deaminase n=1 Tax=Candidatus Carbonibacillus altaicus TaxID=2163959 RepID=A0A2R6Y148_9BACL|nr:L-serine ammonia-lyase, iron-sulfur-dependent, subunit beta [Candidatus Carbobacillus altaicus]PTQ56397.1 MAG: L-serine dehydratase, beta subunit [Candidatus Carbobacillus altaicus]